MDNAEVNRVISVIYTKETTTKYYCQNIPKGSSPLLDITPRGVISE